MPYIKQELRDKLDGQLSYLINAIRSTPIENRVGALNYCISNLLITVKNEGEPWRYRYINDVIGVLNCVAYEFDCRVAGPYEELARDNNGDIAIYSEGP